MLQTVLQDPNNYPNSVADPYHCHPHPETIFIKPPMVSIKPSYQERNGRLPETDPPMPIINLDILYTVDDHYVHF
jgi:hypothetical protein